MDDEKLINKLRLLAAPKPTGQETRASGLRRDIPNIQRRPQTAALAAFERQHPNNRNAQDQAAFVTGAYNMAKLSQHFQLHFKSASRIMKFTSILINQDQTLGFEKCYNKYS